MTRAVMRIAGGAGCVFAVGLPVIIPEAAGYGSVIFILSLALYVSGWLRWR